MLIESIYVLFWLCGLNLYVYGVHILKKKSKKSIVVNDMYSIKALVQVPRIKI